MKGCRVRIAYPVAAGAAQVRDAYPTGLEGINGVGKARAEKYGNAFLAIPRESFAASAPESAPAPTGKT